MLGYLGQYEFQVDGKGRVSLPSAYRRGAPGSAFVLLQWQPTHLDLYPADTWAAIQVKLLEFRRAQADEGTSGGASFRRIVSRAVEVEPDKQGRIRIPGRLRESAGVAGTVLLVGAVDRIELWSPERFEGELENGTGDFEQFASQIFG